MQEKKCAFLNHIGDSHCSPHNNAMKVCEDLLNQSMYINNIINYRAGQNIPNCTALSITALN